LQAGEAHGLGSARSGSSDMMLHCERQGVDKAGRRLQSIKENP